MPRPKSEVPRLVRHAAYQAGYRERLAKRGKPEASAVDISIAGAVARAIEWRKLELDAGRKPTGGQVIGYIMRESQTVLVDDGYDALRPRRRSYRVSGHGH